MHEIKIEINRVEHEAIRARQLLDQRLQGFERAGAWTDDRMAEEFRKWQTMHRESVKQTYDDNLAMMEQRLVSMEQAVGELKGLQTQMAEFKTAQESVVTMLTRIESKLSKIE